MPPTGVYCGRNSWASLAWPVHLQKKKIHNRIQMELKQFALPALENA